MTFYIYQISNIIYFIYQAPIWYLSDTYLVPIWYLSGTYLVPDRYPNFGMCTPPIWYLIYTRYILFRPVISSLINNLQEIKIIDSSSYKNLDEFSFADVLSGLISLSLQKLICPLTETNHLLHIVIK